MPVGSYEVNKLPRMGSTGTQTWVVASVSGAGPGSTSGGSRLRLWTVGLQGVRGSLSPHCALELPLDAGCRLLSTLMPSFPLAG